MKIGILCFRSYDGYEGKSEIRMKAVAEELGHEVLLIQIPLCTFSPDGEIFYNGQPFPEVDGLISRARVIDQVENRLYLLKLLEEKGFFVVNGYDALLKSKNKWVATETLRKTGVRTVPTWVCEDESMALRLAETIGYPVVVKTPYGTYGKGVAKGENAVELRSILWTFWKPDCITPILLQPFVAEAEGKDHRVFVVDGKVVAAMERSAPSGDFRAYSPKAEDARPVEISEEEADLAIRATTAVGLNNAGVDVIHTQKGPAVLEVNGNAGLMRISTVTGIDVPRAIIEAAVARFGKVGRGVRKE